MVVVRMVAARGTRALIRALVPPRIRKALLVRKYRGDRYECPCCGLQFRQFWPSGVENTPNTLCPNCGSLQRHRLLWLFFQRNPSLLSSGQRILHVAPEPILERLLRSIPGVKYLSADLESPGAMVRMDLTRIPCPDDSFDGILCCHVLEHIPDDAAAMRELYRVLAPGGWAILQVPVKYHLAQTYEDPSITDPSARLAAFGQEDHVRVYGPDYVERLRSAGFLVEEISIQEELGPELTERYCLQPDERVHLCRKEAAANP